MIQIPPFKAKLARDPELRETTGGDVCNMRVRQVDPGKRSLFIDVGVFGEKLAKDCMKLAKGDQVEIAGGLIYSEWVVPARGRRKAQVRSKHSIMANSVAVVGA